MNNTYDDDDLRWKDVGAITDWAQGSAHRVHIGARRIGVYRIHDQWYALKDVCPHAGLSLCSASNREGCLEKPEVSCPAHGWLFDLESGEQIGAGITGNSTCATYPVKIINDRVFVGV